MDGADGAAVGCAVDGGLVVATGTAVGTSVSDDPVAKVDSNAVGRSVPEVTATGDVVGEVIVLPPVIVLQQPKYWPVPPGQQFPARPASRHAGCA
jgi:hypothetical protein